jgi:hypothetical protein
MKNTTYMLRVLIVGLAVALVCMAFVAGAWSHEAIPTASAPLGWKYPFDCCSGFDCREVAGPPDGVVRETAAGYVIAKTGEVIRYNDPKVKASPDGRWHWCSVAGLDDSRTICLYVPPRGF